MIITGELSSISTSSRQFELIDKNKQKISGIFQSEISDKEINDFKRKYENNKAMIHVRINRPQLNTDKQSINYELLEIEEIGK